MKIVRQIYTSIRGIPSLGLMGATKLFLARHLGFTFNIRPKGYPSAIQIRGKTSDPSILADVIVFREYDIPGLEHVETIVDAGANIGLASIYFAQRFPKALIIALEPEPSNFRMLQRNTSHLKNVTALHAALWPTKTRLAVMDPNTDKWGFQFAPTSQDSAAVIETVTMSDLIGKGIDLLKIDIEGGENALFSENCDWLRLVRNICIEIHPGCWKTVLTAFEGIEYDCRISGENLVFHLVKP